MTTLSGPNFEVTPPLRDHVRRRSGEIRNRARRRVAVAALGTAVVMAGVAMTLTTHPDATHTTVIADQPPAHIGPSRALPVPRLATHLVPGKAVAQISPDLKLSRGNVPNEDYIVGVSQDASPAQIGVLRLWSGGYRIPADPPVPNDVIQVSSEVIEYEDEATAASTLDRLNEAAQDAGATLLSDLVEGFDVFVPDIPESASRLPSSSEWIGVSRTGRHLIIVRLRAIGTADWTPQFVELLHSADDAARGLGD